MGNASWGVKSWISYPVHPHGCGERARNTHSPRARSGSSPRVWGTPKLIKGRLDIRRFIPTGVGNALVAHPKVAAVAVHPHGCGERIRNGEHEFIVVGSSPRVWGTHPIFSKKRRQHRFIPTGVGNAPTVETKEERFAVHPHGCGERRITCAPLMMAGGSSPRVWGTPKSRTNKVCVGRFIPTGVGNAHVLLDMLYPTSVHPHGCGERLAHNNTVKMADGSSPRVWGTLGLGPVFQLTIRFIPTGVGNAQLQLQPNVVRAVHPHGCGER